MKYYLILLIFVKSLNPAFAQVLIADQPDLSYHRMVLERCRAALPDSQSLKNLKTQALPINLADTLRRYDWYNIASYDYREFGFSSPLSTGFDTSNYQLDFIRYDTSGTIGEFYARRKRDSANIYTTTFDKKNAGRLTGVRKVGKIFYLVTDHMGNIAYQPVVSYKNNILVVDITIDGKTGNRKIRYRQVYYGIDKTFNW